MTKLPARGFKVGNVTPQAKSAMLKKAMGNMQSGGPVPAGPRKTLSHKTAMAPVGTKLAPKMLNSTNPAHTNRTRAIQVAQNAPGLAMQGYPSA